MTKTITVTLTGAAAGIWTYTVGETMITIATGVTIQANQDYWQVAEGLEPYVKAAFGTERDALVLCVNPGATDLMGQPDTAPVCQFRIIDGNVEAQV